MYPDLLGNFILTLIEKGYRVSVVRDQMVDTLIIMVSKYESVQYYAQRMMTFGELNSMTKDIQKIWFDGLIEWFEAEFLKLRRQNKND